MQAFASPFRVLVDGREKLPYRFEGLRTDASLGRRPIAVDVAWAHLATGDYTLAGCEKLVAVERKSKADLYSTLGQHRERFEEEHRRLAELGAGNAVVVIEASWDELLVAPERSRLEPKVVHRTALSWLQRYGVPWLAMGSRRLAEVTTYRFLERWWYELQANLSARSGICRICGKPLRGHESMRRGMGPICAARGDRALARRIRDRGARP